MSQKERLLEIIESFRRKNHYYLDEDCWYSCPAHENYCGDDERVCRCGLAKHNAKVDEALQIARGLTPLTLDGGDSAASEQLSTPEVLSTLQGESNPAHRK